MITSNGRFAVDREFIYTYIYIYIYIYRNFWILNIAEQLSNVKRIRSALVSAPGTQTATNLSFWPLRALGISKIKFLGEK